MADAYLKSTAYAKATIADLKKIFEKIIVELNNDYKDQMKLFDLCNRGVSQSELALDSLKYEQDEIHMFMKKGEIVMVHGLPPNMKLTVTNEKNTTSYSEASEQKLLRQSSPNKEQ